MAIKPIVESSTNAPTGSRREFRVFMRERSHGARNRAVQVPTVEHKFHVYMEDGLGNSDYQQHEFVSRRFSDNEVVNGLVQLAETARLMLPRESPGVAVRYAYASREEDGTQHIRKQGLPAFDAYLREHGIDILPLRREHYMREE